jgi:ABC-2 type transport system permease protein
MPTWLRGFAEHQPATPVTETIRGLLLGHASGGIMIVSVALSAILFRRRTAA